jgi:hypothetical protein
MEKHNLKLETVELASSDFDLAAVLLAEAFYDNPSHEYIFAESSTRLKFLQWGLKTNLKLNLASSSPIGKSFALVESGKPPGIRQVRAMAFWHPPKSNSPSLNAKVQSGWILAPLKFGIATSTRLSEVMTAMEQIKAQVLGQNKAWYLNNMAVDKKLRGTGVGTQLLAQELRSRSVGGA